jgi:hypothetical protein
MVYLGIAILVIYGGSFGAVAAIGLPAVFFPRYRKALWRRLSN